MSARPMASLLSARASGASSFITAPSRVRAAVIPTGADVLPSGAARRELAGVDGQPENFAGASPADSWDASGVLVDGQPETSPGRARRILMPRARPGELHVGRLPNTAALAALDAPGLSRGGSRLLDFQDVGAEPRQQLRAGRS